MNANVQVFTVCMDFLCLAWTDKNTMHLLPLSDAPDCSTTLHLKNTEVVSENG